MPICTVGDRAQLSQILQQANIGQNPTFIKVNWTSPHQGMYTEPATLKRLLSVLSRPVVLLESYAVGRHDGPVDQLPEDNEQYMDAMRQADRRFFEQTGMREILNMNSVSYFNITEAVHSGDVVAPHTVQNAVTAAFGPLQFSEIYGHLPQAIYQQRQKVDFINLARMKVPAEDDGDWSLAFKNMFGLIPTPDRRVYHEKDLPGAILDINRVYRTFFDVIDIVEGLNSVVVYSKDGNLKAPWGRYQLRCDQPLIAYNQDPVRLEREIAERFGRDISGRKLIRLAQKKM